MKPRALFERDGIPLDDPQDELMDSPEGAPAPGQPPGGEEDAMGAEPPPMDAPMGDEPPGAEGLGAEDLNLDDPGIGGADEGGLDGPSGPGLDEPEEDSDGPVGAHGAGAITGKYNSSPVGDIKMSKSKGTYNTYKLEMSMGQLEVIRTALEHNHADPVSDELLATLTYYMDKLPGPGEEEEEAEARNNPLAAAAKAGLAAPGGEEGAPIPLPPGQAAGAPAPAPKGGSKKYPPKPGETPPTPAKERLMANAPGGPTPGKAPGGKKPPVGLPDLGGEPDQLPAPPAE